MFPHDSLTINTPAYNHLSTSGAAHVAGMFNSNPAVRCMTSRTCQVVQTSSGQVLRVTYGNNGSYFFVKTFPLVGERHSQEFLKHVESVRQMTSARLAPIIAVCHFRNTFEILLEWMPNGSLHSLIYQKEIYPTLPFCLCVKILADVAEGLSHLHSLTPPFAHQGLKPCNILMDGRYNAKVSDAGNATLQDVVSSTVSSQRSRMYLSPERLQSGAPSPEDDIYSFGVTGYEIVARQPPFAENTHPLKLETMITQGHRPQPSMDVLLKAMAIPSSQCTPLVELVNCCWHQDPTLRPSMANCHTLLRKIQQTFSTELMDHSVNSLLKQKETADKTAKKPIHEYIQFVDSSRMIICGKSAQRFRTQSSPEESNAAAIPKKEQRSASMPCTNSGEYVLPSRTSPPAANHMPGTTHQQESFKRKNLVGWNNGHSNHVPTSEGISQLKSLNGSYTEALIEYREKAVGCMTDGRLNQLLDILKSNQIFSREEYESVKSISILQNRARRFLDICQEKGEKPSEIVVKKYFLQQR